MAALAPAALAVDASPAAPVIPAAPALGFDAGAVTAGLPALSAAAIGCIEDVFLDAVFETMAAEPAAMLLLLAAGDVAVFIGSVEVPGDLASLAQAAADANNINAYNSDIGRMDAKYWPP